MGIKCTMFERLSKKQGDNTQRNYLSMSARRFMMFTADSDVLLLLLKDYKVQREKLENKVPEWMAAVDVILTLLILL